MSLGPLTRSGKAKNSMALMSTTRWEFAIHGHLIASVNDSTLFASKLLAVLLEDEGSRLILDIKERIHLRALK
jgi:hypothetical protein